jgi:hypothetical protein
MKIERNQSLPNDYNGERIRKEQEGKKSHSMGQDQLELQHEQPKQAFTYRKPDALTAEQRQEMVQRLKHEADIAYSELRSLVTKSLKEQGVTFEEAIRGEKEFTIDEEARQQAEVAISEEGPFGVKKTTERIMEFARALAGDDPSKASELREAVKRGFKEAEQFLGGDLPSLSKETYSSVMKEFDRWEGIEPEEHIYLSEHDKQQIEQKKNEEEGASIKRENEQERETSSEADERIKQHEQKVANAAVDMLKQIELNQSKYLQEQLKSEQQQANPFKNNPLPSVNQSNINIKG